MFLERQDIIMKRLFWLLAFAALTPASGWFVHAQDAMLLQSWIASDGRVTQATFVRLEDESVVIEKEGKQFAVPLAKLNTASVELARKLALQVASAPLESVRFVLIPGGEYIMGDALDGDTQAPPHRVNVSSFRMSTTEVTKAQWDQVRDWAMKHGYDDLPEGGGKKENHPVQMLPWCAVVKWCNAKSEMEELTPCYYEDAAHTVVFKWGEAKLDSTTVKWSANGYRLPTEAEWEKAARGGLIGKRFPWGDTISHAQGNYKNRPDEHHQTGPAGFHPTYKAGEIPYTAPVGSFAANGYGLYDMAGNVMEWCWDWYASYPRELQTDPRGPRSGWNRLFRGGCWESGEAGCGVAHRFIVMQPAGDNGVGFRLARGYVP